MKNFVSMLVLSVSIIAVLSTGDVSGHGGYAVPSNTVLRDFGPRDLSDPAEFVNFETAHVHPLDISTDGTQLAVVNTPDGHVEIFNINASTGNLTYSESIKVGMGPVTARWRTASELWVVNQLSDSISVIDMTTSTVVRTIVTYKLDTVSGLLKGSPNGDEPADVVFATYDGGGGGNPYAFVSCSRTDIIQLYDITGADSPNDVYGLRDEVYLQGEDPRSLATNGTNIYAAIFESGNSTTLIFGETGTGTVGHPRNTAAINGNNHTDHPYYIDGDIELGDSSIKAINPAPSDKVGPFTVVGGLGSYIAHGKSIPVDNLMES
ncbi:MAG: beta-propeller fold lactonase family protein, partial [Candidatus Hydrogenedentota bacterium]